MALVFALFQQYWKNRRDAYTARIDEFCKLVFEAADQGAEYWVTKKATKVTKPPPEQIAKAKLAETKIDGFQQKVNLFYAMIEPNLTLGKRRVLVDSIANFLDALTGGNFGAEVRLSDPVRARLVYSTAADLVSTLRATSARITLLSVLLAIVAVIVFLGLAFHPFAKALPAGWVAI